MKKTVFFCIGLTISASLFAATGSNTKKTSKAKTTVTKTASTKKSASTSKNANAKKETKDKKNTETKKNTGSKTESKKGTVNSKNSKSNTTKNKDTSSKETKKSTVSTKSTKTTKETKTATARSRKTETAKPKRTASVVASSSWEETGNATEVSVEREVANQGSVMITNLNTMYQNKDENINVTPRNKEVANTFEKEIEEREKYTHFQTGMASYYGGSCHGKKTANGEIFNENSLTAAHKTLPFGTKVKVTNLDNGKSVVVRINNRGPYSKGRVIDLSKAAFSKIASTSKGVTRVKLEVAKYYNKDKLKLYLL